ncbi:hypothetical protein SAMN06269250_2110 [Spirosoma fluviale]|uniref:Uncharacterized protein n=1 Tax=Spirosoma fluviale TaxID=1597977 RepID=A0A286FGY8_9BACT|nr:hypothetical protein SAMN06269250_2110 [Spirosoma fluviale]
MLMLPAEKKTEEFKQRMWGWLTYMILITGRGLYISKITIVSHKMPDLFKKLPANKKQAQVNKFSMKRVVDEKKTLTFEITL